MSYRRFFLNAYTELTMDPRPQVVSAEQEKEITEKLGEINPAFKDCFCFDEALCDDMNWKNYEGEMIELSKSFPFTVFVLESFSTTSDSTYDRCVEYFYRGQYDYCPLVCYYEEPNTSFGKKYRISEPYL